MPVGNGPRKGVAASGWDLAYKTEEVVDPEKPGLRVPAGWVGQVEAVEMLVVPPFTPPPPNRQRPGNKLSHVLPMILPFTC